MLARRTVLEHPIAGPIELPLLVPAFTSKGFPLIRKGGQVRSEVTNALSLTAPHIHESLLLSAYDIHHRYVAQPHRFYRGKVLVFIDSGAYELMPDWDSTEPKQGPYKGKGFSESDYRRVLKKLPDRLPFAIANYDWGTRRRSLKGQILAAQKLFSHFPRFLRTFIIKPGRKKHLSIDDVIPHIEKLRVFDIVGVVEKELGNDLLSRLVNVARLRSEMDRKKVSVPIHVWGGLDPVITPLYFFAGAEVFDGVSWLRYAYHHGMAIHRGSHCVLNAHFGIETPSEHAKALTLGHNLRYLGRLTTALKRFVDEGGRNLEMFNQLDDDRSSKLGESLRRAFDALCTRVPEAKGEI